MNLLFTECERIILIKPSFIDSRNLFNDFYDYKCCNVYFIMHNERIDVHEFLTFENEIFLLTDRSGVDLLLI